jgi:2,4-dichlorophenol 6-monooxygenase
VAPRAGEVSPENAIEDNSANVRRIWSGRPQDAAQRSAALRAIRAQSMEFSELNVEFGYTYESAAVVPDGSPERILGRGVREAAAA